MDCDVVVVGAGLTGSSAAWQLAVRGLSVTLLEARDIGHTEGSSHGTSRIYRRAYADSHYIELTGRAEESWDELEGRSGTTLRTRTGGLDHGAERDPEALLTLMERHGVPAELLGAQAAAERFPGMEFAGPVMFHPDAGHLDAGRTVRAGVDVAAAAGATVVERSPVIRIEPMANGVLAHTAGRTIRAGCAVVAAGPWLPELLPSAGVAPRLPRTWVTQQQVFHFRHRDPRAAWPTMVHKEGIQLFGLPSGADGGSAPAMKIAQHDGGTPTTASRRDGVIDPVSRETVTSWVKRWLPGLDPEPVAEQSCLYTMTADEDFVIDRTGSVVVASPCSGHGAKFAPLIGSLVADLVQGERPHPRFAFRD
ncbi:FAD-dependent oxidoreductase [Streptomyces hygroscopicus]|uniref:FAD-dependent oxidoreductase n=1 Tax=Streptomyces hygroscopicus TaxID=1912 RepID=UPI0004C965BC|nr:FAD-dependent oxidoreductase [Streptomyces hygroscopicus]